MISKYSMSIPTLLTNCHSIQHLIQIYIIWEYKQRKHSDFLNHIKQVHCYYGLVYENKENLYRDKERYRYRRNKHEDCHIKTWRNTGNEMVGKTEDGTVQRICILKRKVQWSNSKYSAITCRSLNILPG